MRQKFKKSMSLLLAFIMVLGVFATLPLTTFAAGVDYDHNASTSSDDYYTLISKADWDNAPGISESEIVLNNDAGDCRQVIHIMKADVKNEYVSVIPTYSEMNTSKYQTGTMLDQANWIDENMDGEVMGVMNCCLSWYTGYAAERVGEPLGFMMMNGEIMFDPGNCGYTYGNVGFPTCVVINKDVDENGNSRPADIPKVEMPQIRSSADLDGWEETVIPVSSGYVVKNGVNQSKAAHKNDPAPRSVVGITADGQVVMMLNDGRQSPFSAGMNMYEVAEVMIAAGCVFAANCDGGGSSTFVSQRPGEELKVNNSPSDGGLRPSTSGICFLSTAPANGQFYKAHITADSEYYTPGSAVEFTAIGTDMAGTVVDVPADAVWQLTDASFGTIKDGVFTSNGKEGKVTVQLVYNDEVVGEASITIVLPDISFRNDTIVIGYGDAMELPIEVTTNEGRNPVAYKAGDIVYTFSDNGLGTLDGDKFTACDADAGLTGGTITAVICGQDAKKVSATIRFGKASEIVYDFEDAQLPIDTSNTGNIGGDDAEDTGEYIYGWHISDTRQNGHFSYRFYAKKNYTPVGMDIPAKVYLTDEMSRNGDYAMGIDIDWTNVTASCHGQMDIFLPEPLDLTDATRVGFWMYIPAEMVTASMQIRAGFRTTTDGSTAVTNNVTDFVNSTSGVGNGGWFYFSWEVLDTYKTFDYFQINSHYTAGEGNYNYYQNLTYYVDDFTVDYSDATIDRENPYFTSLMVTDENGIGAEISGQTITENNITLMAQAYENTAKTNATGLNRNSVKLYVDGVLSNASVSMANNGTITVTGLYLNDGVHTLVMEVSDNQGNVGNIVRKLVVNTAKSDVRLEVPAASGLLPTGSIFWLNVVADNLAKVDSVTITVNLDYVNDWELEGMEVAYGFKAEYYVNNHNDAVITFTRTGDEIADTTILAKLPVRIWMARGWMDDSGIRKDYISDDPKKQDKYWILTPHAMWYSDGTRDYRLVVSAEAGVVTYVDGSTMTFSANETVIQTEMNRYYTNADRQGKWSFHICTPGTAQSKAPTCTESGYENRVFCVGCACGSVDNLGTQCDTHNGCGSVLDWGTTVPATGVHTYDFVDGKLACISGGELFSGVHTDGKTYVDGVVMADGWNGESYYKDGVMYTGVQLVDGKYYDFGEDGICAHKYPITGWWTNDEGVSRYLNVGVPIIGYNMINTVPTFFDDNGIAYDGEIVISGETCVFEKGVFVKSTTADVLLAGLAGPKAYFILYADGTFVLSGEGATYDYLNVGQTFAPNISWKNRPWGKQDQPMSQSIKNIVVGKDITSVGNFTFYLCTNVRTVTFEEGSKLTKIASAAFCYMPYLKEVRVPDTVTFIGNTGFAHCAQLTNVYLPQNISHIDDTAFKNSTKVNLSVAEGTYAERYAKAQGLTYTVRAFENVAVAEGQCGANATWALYANGKMVISGSGDMADYANQGQQPWAAYRNQIKHIVIGKDITSVGVYAFAFAHSVQTITFEEGSKLTDIGAVAFYYSLYVQEVNIPETVKSIGTLAFGYCNVLTNVYMPQDTYQISSGAFKNSNKVTLDVAEGSFAEEYAKKNNIAHTVREYVYIPVASGNCGANATWTLYGNGQLLINGFGAMDNYANQSQQPWAAYRDQIKHIVIGKDITSVGVYAFAFAHSVQTITFEEGSKVENIGAVAFYYQVYIKDVELPETVKSIGNLAFGYCGDLVNVYVPQDTGSIASGAFKNSAKVTLAVASDSYAEKYAKQNGIAYTTREYVYVAVASGNCGENATWALYGNGQLVISGSGAMDNYANRGSQPWAAYRDQIKSVVIGKDITSIGSYAFAYAHSIFSITFEEGSKLESIGAVSFYYALYLTEVNLPASVKSIDNLAFGNNSKLTTVVMGEDVSVHVNAFLNTPYASAK